MKAYPFSVLISVYVKENPYFFREALESVRMQSLVPNEIVIVKDGKLTDDLEIVIQEYRQIWKDCLTIVSLDENVGLGLALAEGIKQCRYEYIARMDTDDICVANRFETQMNYLKKDTDLAVCGMWIEEFSKIKGDMGKIRMVPMNSSEIYSMLKKRNPMNHVTVMFKRSAVLEVGNYEAFQSYEDYYLWAKMLKKGYKFMNIAEVGVHVRVGNNMIGRRIGWSYYKSEYQFFQRLRKMKILSPIELYRNMLVRLVRFLPAPILQKIYSIYLRR